jgi:hypothetical protein
MAASKAALNKMNEATRRSGVQREFGSHSNVAYKKIAHPVKYHHVSIRAHAAGFQTARIAASLSVCLRSTCQLSIAKKKTPRLMM